MGDWFTAAQSQYDNELPPYLDNESDEDELDDEDEE
jgi:hypothetical protein